MIRDVHPGASDVPDEQRCPKCGTDGLPVLIGLADESAVEAAAAGELISGGCMRLIDGNTWGCSSGHEWAADDQAWTQAVNRALAGRPRCRGCGGATRRVVYPRALAYLSETVGLAEEIAAGEAEMAADDGPPDVYSIRICRDCRTVAA
ncbi:hypothetical protein [Catellatospora vulcania]|uniref:hypothetical protein n=1 Tax=Catellatospora vulcania TaxID=1460450 RepID=UPI0012D3DFF3|nr:hypothetical protein [Catellatospora vulcania]